MTPKPTLSIIAPAYREAGCLPALVQRLLQILEPLAIPFEILIVDDGSDDGTLAWLIQQNSLDARIKGLCLSRRFGKEAALHAGLRAAAGDAVVTMDADLQHPPELIPQLLAFWREGAQVVHGEHASKERDGALRGLGSRLFNRLFSRLTGFNMERASDFKLLDRAVVDIIAWNLPETRRFYRGLSQWVGFTQASVSFQAGERWAGRAGWSLPSLAKYAASSITAFTSLPLLLLPLLGLAMLLVASLLGTEALVSRLQGRAISGFATLEITLLFVGSCTMIGMGFLGQYLAQIYDEIKARPSYLVQTRIGL